ncbi:MAG: hypothetical protein HY329_17175 [Chloroflexi bacterium]|nr:hypothetical protein [Chloroflexota bacterium]
MQSVLRITITHQPDAPKARRWRVSGPGFKAELSSASLTSARRFQRAVFRRTLATGHPVLLDLPPGLEREGAWVTFINDALAARDGCLRWPELRPPVPSEN